MRSRCAHCIWTFALFLLMAPLPYLHAAPKPEPQTHEEFQAKWMRELPRLVESCIAERDPAIWKELEEEIFNHVVHLDHKADDALGEVVAGGPIAQKEIPVAATTQTIVIHKSKPIFPLQRRKLRYYPYSELQPPFVDRRIAKNAIEVWTSREGWLFNDAGRLLNHVTVPRRDGGGQEWFGAFLPDGRWVTTALWERDDTLYVFSKRGKCLKEITTMELAPPITPFYKNRQTGGIIGWARADAKGDGWVLGVIGYGDESIRMWVGPNLKGRNLQGIEQWILCYPRQLGWRYKRVPSDDGQRLLTAIEASHGMDVGYTIFKVRCAPYYEIMLPEAAQWKEPGIHDPGEYNVRLAAHSRNAAGFWPGSHMLYIRDAAGRSWFIGGDGKCRGWIMARRFEDAADGKSMLFKTPDGAIVTLSPEMKVSAVRRFVSPTGAILDALAIYDDLEMGLFLDKDNLVLARWGKQPESKFSGFIRKLAFWKKSKRQS